MATVSSVVATGLRTKGSEIFMRFSPPAPVAAQPRFAAFRLLRCAAEAAGQPIEEEIDHRRRVERQQLAQDQSAYNGDAQRPAQFRSHAGAKSQRQAAQQRCHGGHHDGAEAQQAGLIDGVDRRHMLHAFGFKREIDHHDGVLLHDADQQHDADQRNDAEVVPVM